jgi:hypothetical protein
MKHTLLLVWPLAGLNFDREAGMGNFVPADGLDPAVTDGAGKG